MPEIIVVTVKKTPFLTALFINGRMVYDQHTGEEHPSIRVAMNLADAMSWPKTCIRSVNLPHEGEGMMFDGRTYLKAKRYLEYRDRSTARQAGREYEEPTLVFTFENEPSVALAEKG